MGGRLVAAVVTTFIVGGIGGLQLLGGKRYSIAAGPVTGDTATGLSGTFRLTEHRPIEIKAAYPFVTFWFGISSQQTGGACMVAHPEDLGPAYGQMINSNCSANSECYRDVQANGRFVRENGYCDIPTKTCWVRPGPGIPMAPPSAPYCNRSLDYDPRLYWEAGKDHPANRTLLTTPAPAPGKSIRYRVVACLHQINPATGLDSGDCGTLDGKLRREVMGPIKVVSANP